MYTKIEPFGYAVYGELIGSTWLSLVEAVVKNGQITTDEGRKRYSLQNIRVRSATSARTDPLIAKYANQQNIAEIVKLTFNKDLMYDIDVTPSFTPGAQSYYARIKNWKMLDFIVGRLTEIPESKKAVMSFIREEDYIKVLKNPKDDYLPCITTIQFRLLKIDNEKGYHMNIIFSARSMDAYQKSIGNLVAIAILGEEVAKRLKKNLGVPVWEGSIDGLITDAHIYDNTIDEARKLLESYKKIESNESHEKA
ncbi:MAG: thymidylate synthase [bacterium]|nr:thymidylate synthase [bacterium]